MVTPDDTKTFLDNLYGDIQNFLIVAHDIPTDLRNSEEFAKLVEGLDRTLSGIYNLKAKIEEKK